MVRVTKYELLMCKDFIKLSQKQLENNLPKLGPKTNFVEECSKYNLYLFVIYNCLLHCLRNKVHGRNCQQEMEYHLYRNVTNLVCSCIQFYPLYTLNSWQWLMYIASNKHSAIKLWNLNSLRYISHLLVLLL